jgi:hypothetical protein
MSWTHATRNLKHTSSDTLAKQRDATAVLIAHEHQISPRVMTDLLLIREATTAALHDLATSGIDWSWWTVILLKPDCLALETRHDRSAPRHRAAHPPGDERRPASRPGPVLVQDSSMI